VVEYDVDRYGRIVGMVYVGNLCVNEQLVKNGLAWVYRRYCKIPMCSEWLELEMLAKWFSFNTEGRDVVTKFRPAERQDPFFLARPSASAFSCFRHSSASVSHSPVLSCFDWIY